MDHCASHGTSRLHSGWDSRGYGCGFQGWGAGPLTCKRAGKHRAGLMLWSTRRLVVDALLDFVPLPFHYHRVALGIAFAWSFDHPFTHNALRKCHLQSTTLIPSVIHMRPCMWCTIRKRDPILDPHRNQPKTTLSTLAPTQVMTLALTDEKRRKSFCGWLT